MARKKPVIDAAVAAATEERGLFLVVTGNGKGKGKSTAAFGTLVRARSRFYAGHAGPRAGHRDRASRRGWARAARMLRDPAYGLVVLDELTYPLSYQYVDADVGLDALAHRPPMQHVIVTGRAAGNALVELADTVSVIADEKHARRAGIKAQKGVDL